MPGVGGQGAVALQFNPIACAVAHEEAELAQGVDLKVEGRGGIVAAVHLL